MVVFLFHFLILFKSFKNYDYEDFADLSAALDALKELAKDYEDCYYEIGNITHFTRNYLKKNSKLINSIGKGMDDIGDELECRKSNVNEDYLFIKYSIKKDKDKYHLYNLSKYLERNYSFIGMCLPKNCDPLFKEIKNSKHDNNSYINNLNSTIIKNLTDKVINLYMISDIKDNKAIVIIYLLFLLFFLFKVLVGIISKFKYQKGYSYHGFDLYLKLPENIGNINIDEEEQMKNEKLISAKLIDKNGVNKIDEKALEGEYNPLYDFEPFYPMYFRWIKYLDIFNNFYIFSRKRDRYYNEKNISIISSLKAIILFGHIYNKAIRVYIKMPNTSVFNFKFYNSFGLTFYKIAINSLNFWVILEAATFSFKLMKFIKKNFYLKGKNITTKKEKNNFVFKLCLKYICFYIPKIITFTFIFIFFYYLFEDKI